MSLLHGTPVWTQYVDTPLVHKVWTVLDELDEPDVAFIPYWEWQAINDALNAEGVYATAYSGEDRLLLVLSNLSASEREIALPLSEIRAKNGALNQVVDNMHDLPVRVDGDVVTCVVGAKNFRLISFTR